MHRLRSPLTGHFARLRKGLTLSDYLRSAKRLTPSELQVLAALVRSTGQGRCGNAERVATAIESVAAARAASNSSAMRRDAPATTLFERLSDWATASF